MSIIIITFTQRILHVIASPGHYGDIHIVGEGCIWEKVTVLRYALDSGTTTQGFKLMPLDRLARLIKPLIPKQKLSNLKNVKKKKKK